MIRAVTNQKEQEIVSLFKEHLRELMGKKPAPEFHRWLMKKGLMDEHGKLTAMAGDASIFL